MLDRELSIPGDGNAPSSAWSLWIRVAVGFTVVAVVTGCNQHQPAPANATVPVHFVTSRQSDVPVEDQWVASLDGNVNAQIQPQVTGYLVKQLYREGSVVEKGQILFEIDPRPFQAVLDQALAQVEQAEGSLGQAEAQLKLAKINVDRDTPLVAEHAISQSQLDKEVQEASQQEANVRAAHASIAAAKANVESAKLNLGFTYVKSLITGVAGKATTQVGNLVGQQSVLTSVSQMDPIKVYFSISDSEYLSLTRRVNGNGSDLLRDSSAIPLTLRLADGTVFPQHGKIVYVDREMNQQTGAISIAALFPNPGNLLRPGQYGRVSASTEIRRHAITIPQDALTDLQGQKQVFTIGPDNKAHAVNVLVGPEIGPDVVILQGLSSGARVIVDNLQKLSEGTAVAGQSTNAAVPASEPGSAGGR